MNISKIYLHNLRNNEFFEFSREFIALAKAAPPSALRIEPQFAAYLTLHARVDEALKKIAGSTMTADILELDHRRGDLLRGIRDLADAGLVHFADANHAAARRVGQVLDTYKGVTRTGVIEQTSIVYNLLKELNDHHADDVELLGLVPWVVELDRVNIDVERTIAARTDEEAARTPLILKEVRAEAADAYAVLAGRIDALALVEGGEVYDRFIGELNVIVARYHDLIAVRRGRAAARKEEEKRKKQEEERVRAAASAAAKQ